MQYALVFNSKEELDEAVARLEGKTTGRRGGNPDAVLAEKLEAALAMSPLNAPKATVLRTWLQAPEGEWVPYSSVVEAFVKSGLGASSEQASNRASAAIRDLSWQVAQTLPRADLASHDKAIEALASRSRASGSYAYRLTPAGRIAGQRFLAKHGEV
jgi:hypothetical protein